MEGAIMMRNQNSWNEIVLNIWLQSILYQFS